MPDSFEKHWILQEISRPGTLTHGYRLRNHDLNIKGLQ